MAALPAPERTWTVGEIRRMVEVGILGKDERVELIGGRLIKAVPHDRRHSDIVGHVHRMLTARYRDRNVQVVTDVPVELSTHDLPNPDVAVIRGSPHPAARDLVLVVEVAGQALALARAKAATYAAAKVPCYWLVDLARSRIEVHTEPEPGGWYSTVRIVSGADEIVLPEVRTRIPASDVIP